MIADHPHTDPGDGRVECPTCGKWVWLVIHSCKRVPMTPEALARLDYYDPRRQQIDAEHEHCVLEDGVRWFGHGMECRRPELHGEG